MTDVILPTTRKRKTSSTALALRQQEAGSARLAVVAPPASCILQPVEQFPIPTYPPRILRLPDVMKRVGLCRASIYNHMADGSFPLSLSLGARAVGWLEHEIDTWLMMRMQARPPAPAVNLLTDH